jgi:phosphatidylglycerophosphatase A
MDVAAIWRNLAVGLATGMGVGRIVSAPGTVGTALWGLPLAWAISLLPGVEWQLVIIVVLIAVGVPITTAAGKALGGEKDNQSIVWDEIVTMPIAFLLVPLNGWATAIIGFLLHRLMDITKPPPARQVERLPEGLGVMADDVVAAIYACLALAGVAWLDRTVGWNFLSSPIG